ncbi:MAG TPA: Flp family type IVb pilin [Chloroflexota bacterium]
MDLTLINRFFVEEEGADATEYALVLGLVALAIVLGAIFLGGQINAALSHIGNRVNACTNSTGAAPGSC